MELQDGSPSWAFMTDRKDTPPITQPLAPEAVDGYVEAVDPPEWKLKMTADAAEISGLRMLDAADKARKAIKAI